MTKDEFNSGLLEFLDGSPTPFHTTNNMSLILDELGFTKLDERDEWSLQFGKKYYVSRGETSLIAFNYTLQQEYLMLGSHTDSPTLKLKPNPLIKEHGVVKLAVEKYGGAKLSSWFDRDLSLAGKIYYIDKNNQAKSRLVDIKEPLCSIASLAIHLEQKDTQLNTQTDLNPIISSDKNFNLESLLGDDVAELLSYELSLYDTQKATLFGANSEFIASSRLDNLLSCYVGLVALTMSDSSKAMLFYASDYEEVGSVSRSGADGSFLRDTLLRVFKTDENFIRTMQSSLFISMDNAHALHPNYTHRYDLSHAPLINEGVAIKLNSNHRYASTSSSVAKFKLKAKEKNFKYQTYVTRGDVGCGSTIGPSISASLGVESIDIGLPTWAMHSIREVCGSSDAYELCKFLIEPNLDV